MALQVSFTEEAEKLNSQYEWNLYKAILLATRRSFDFLRRHMYSAPNCNPFSPSASYPHGMAMTCSDDIFITMHLYAYIRVCILVYGYTNTRVCTYIHACIEIRIVLYMYAFRRHLRVFI